MKIAAPDSIKFKKLKMRLRIPHWQAVGLLESLWLFTARNSPRGDIGRHSDDDIAAAIEWDKDSSELISALVECGWLDRCEAHRLLVHDWAEHMPQWVGGNLARHRREAIPTPAKQPTVQVTVQPTVQATEEAAVQPTVQATSLSSLIFSSPNLPPPEPAKEIVDRGKPRTADELTFLLGPDEQCREWCKVYPPHRMAGEGAIARVLPHAIYAIQTELGNCDEGTAFRHLMDRTRLYANSWKGRHPKQCWGAEKWLTDKHWSDRIEAWEDPDEKMPAKTTTKKAKSAAEENAEYAAKTGGRRM